VKHIVILILITGSVNVNSQSVRKYSNEFLKIGVGGKYLGTGGSLVTSESDPASVFYNPAGVGAFDRVSVSAMHNSYFAGIANFDYVGVVFPLKYRQNIGVSLIRFGIDNIPNTIQLYNPDGSINYDRISSFSISDMALFLSFGRRLQDTQGLSFGGNVKIIKRDYGSFANAWGFGVDAGVQYATDKYRLGIFLQDISSTFSSWNFTFDDSTKKVFAATGNEIPSSSSEITLPSVHFGGQYNFLFGKGKQMKFSPMGKVSIYTDKRNVLLPGPVSADVSLGGEFGIYHIAFLRFGLSNFTKATNDLGEDYLSFQPSIGAGFRLNQFDIDYAFNNVGNSGVGLYSHVFSLSYRFKKKDKYSRPNVAPENSPSSPNTPGNNDNIPVKLD
jgi:hypothetical protein